MTITIRVPDIHVYVHMAVPQSAVDQINQVTKDLADEGDKIEAALNAQKTQEKREDKLL